MARTITAQLFVNDDADPPVAHVPPSPPAPG